MPGEGVGDSVGAPGRGVGAKVGFSVGTTSIGDAVGALVFDDPPPIVAQSFSDLVWGSLIKNTEKGLPRS